MNKYQNALNILVSFAECNPDISWELKYEKETIQELIDKSVPKSNEISMSKETFIDLCRGDIGVMDITGQTLYELTGDIQDYDESLDGDDDEED